MPGLSRFDFYPRDWHLDTRDLTQAAKGIYVDLLASMYARGGPLPMDEHELCRLCGCPTVRSLRPLLAELIAKEKLRVVDDHLVNGRAMEEIAKAEGRQEVAQQGGKAKAEATGRQPNGELSPTRARTAAERQKRYRERQRNGRYGVQAEYELNSSRTQPETRNDFEQNQSGNVCSPSPSPSKKEVPPTEGAVSAPPDRKKPVYDLGKRVLGKSSGGQVTNLIRLHGGDLSATMRTLEHASAKSDPREYIGAVLRGDAGARADSVLAETDRLYRDLGVA